MLKPITYHHSRGTCHIIFSSFSAYLTKLPINTVCIVDKNVYQLYQTIFNDLQKPIFVFHASEKRKTLTSLENILTFFHDNEVDRSYTIIAIGGGITCDIAALAASVWKRGCKLTLIPTTLMAMVDASIGGKTAINFLTVKNSVGTFYHPEIILIDTLFLKTLPVEIYKEGIPEIVKHALTLNKSLLDQLLEIQDICLKQIDNALIYKNITTKLSIIKSDPEEKNVRKILNMGHTVGHAIEITYGLPHGTAVANGIVLELETLALLGYIEDHQILSLSKSILRPFITKKIKNKIEPLLPFLKQDKKRCEEKISIPVVKSIGNTVVEDILLSDFTNALQKALINEY